MGKKENVVITSTEKVTEQQENGIANVTHYNSVSFDVANFGYTSSVLERGANGGMMVKLKNDKGDVVETEVFTEDTTAFDALDSFARLQDFKKLEDLARCYYIHKSAPLAKSAGFKSVGAFLAMQFGLDSSTCNNYRTIGELFLEEKDLDELTENGEHKKSIVWKYDWCKNTTVTNLNQCLSVIRKCKDVEEFFEQYIKTGKLYINASLATVKEQLHRLYGKDDKKHDDKKKDEKQSEKPIQSVRTMWATVKENISTYNLSDAELELFQSACKSIEQILEAHKPKQ